MLYCPKNIAGDGNPDLGPTVQGMGIDIPRAIEERAVASGMTEETFNGLSEIKDIGIRLCDNFDYILAQRSILNHAARPNSNDKEGSQM